MQPKWVPLKTSPGDWKAQEDNIYSSDGIIIATRVQGRYHADPVLRRKEAFDNAKLLALAPKFLEAIQSAMDAVADLDSSSARFEYDVQEIWDDLYRYKKMALEQEHLEVAHAG